MNILLLALFGVFLLAVTNRSYGQDTNASLSGTVSDPSNAIVPGANLTLTNEATGYQQKATANAQGEYTFRNLTPGKYDLNVVAQGFQTTLQKGIELALNQDARIEVRLTVGRADETVTVIGDASLINYESPTLEGGVSPETLEDMPLTISGMPRSAIGLAIMMPGVSTGGTGNAYNARVNGGIVSGDEALLDGVTMQEGVYNQSGMVSLYGDFQMSPDDVSEVHVLTANYGPQYGNTTSGQLIVQSKSGSEKFHGAGFEYNRNDFLNGFQYGTPTYVLDASGNPTGVKTRKSPDKENNYGANIGGPVFLPKLLPMHGSSRKAYFYFNWEAYFQHGSASTPTLTIPSMNARQGNFSNYKDSEGNLIPIYYPVVTDPNNPLYPYSGQLIPNNIVDPVIWAKVQDPIAAAWTALAPTPTNGNEIQNYLPPTSGQGSLVNSENVYMTREDFIFRDSDHFYATYWRQYAQPNLNSYLPKQISTATISTPQNAPISRFNWEHTFSQSMTNHFSFGYLNRNQGYISLDSQVASNLPKVAGVADSDLPGFSTNQSGVGFGGTGGNNYGPAGHNLTGRPTWGLNDVVTMVKGRHTLTAGYEWKNAGGNLRSSINQGGSFYFDQSTTGRTAVNSGFDIASFLLGATSNANVNYYNVGTQYPRQFGSAVHFGDVWRYTPKITVSYGLRWDYTSPFAEKENNLSFFDPLGTNTDACNGSGGSKSCLAGRLAFAGNKWGSASYGAPYPEDLDLNNWSPRVGVSYSPDEKTVVRAGYGIYYGQAFYPGWSGGMSLDGFNLDQNISQIQVNGGAEMPQVFLNYKGFTPFSPTTTSNINAGADNGRSPFYRPEDGNHRPYSSQWNLTIERELPHSFFVSGSYVGTKGTHLPSGKSPINVINPYSATYTTLASTPVIGAGGTTVLDTVLKANYDATIAADGYDGPTVFAQNGVSSPYTNWNAQLDAAASCAPTLAQALTPYPQYCGVLQGNNEQHGNSIYNSFQARVERHFTNGFYILASGTISKMMTDAAETTQSLSADSSAGQGMFSPFNIKPLMALAEDNTPVMGSLTFVYSLPFGRNQRFLNSGPVAGLVGGWRVAPITRYEYGIPFWFHSSACNVVSQVREGCLPAILPGQQLLLHGRSGFDPKKDGSQYINPKALEPASSFTKFGYTGLGQAVTTAYGPDFKDTDISLIKDTKIWEKADLRFTANFFNAFNNHYFVNTGNMSGSSFAFNTTVGAASFGQWNGTVSSPRTIQFAARLEF
jgi:hypothetical protein